ncbi:class I histocompatibility antigen, F10 alpha chain [Meleagris gallopavo]|uniref:class I histocompatibility antigen, F10 alpha chain n=1 Tax=Meleagris gallopavo TaxID=9103 RepID=UPI000549A1FB|nr:class I histocompatibility antigen, F10 alpha chain [Meleagris gallopavo]
MGSCGALGWGLLLLGAVCGAAGEPHSLRYFDTAMTDPGTGLPWFVSVGYVDGEIFVHYDSTARRYVPHTEWVKAPGAVDPEYWERCTQILQRTEQVYRVSLGILQERFNQSGGSDRPVI